MFVLREDSSAAGAATTTRTMGKSCQRHAGLTERKCEWTKDQRIKVIHHFSLWSGMVCAALMVFDLEVVAQPKLIAIRALASKYAGRTARDDKSGSVFVGDMTSRSV